MSKPSRMRHWCLSLPLALVHSFSGTAMGALLSPRKASVKFGSRAHITSCWLTLMTLFACVSMFKFLLTWQPSNQSNDGCGIPVIPSKDWYSSTLSVSSSYRPLPPHPVSSNLSTLEKLFWNQPNGLGFTPCIEFSDEYKKDSVQVVVQREKYLMVVVAGGLNQQRNQIVDAVVIARVLGATLVLPIMQVNPIWEDESEFGDIFDAEHFKATLKDDVRVVNSLPSTHVMFRPLEEKNTPLNASPRWLRAHYAKRMSKDGVLLLRGLDSRLAKDLQPDLQKLRCKVAFNALRFAAPIQALGARLAERMWNQGPYLALHLRLEKDVWVRTGCLPGLGKEFDAEVRLERKTNPKLLTARTRMSFTQRKLAGLCPLTSAELVRLLKALGASQRTRIFWAGGEPFGGYKALEPLLQEFPELYNKESLALPKELEPFRKKASSLAAIDYLVCLGSDVFMQSHGGNFGHVMQGHRAYLGHRKHIVPNKRQMIHHFFNTTMPQEEFDDTIRVLHADSIGQPIHRTNKSERDVLAYPVPECMCQKDAVTDT